MKRMINITLTVMLLLACGNNRAAHRETATDNGSPAAGTAEGMEMPEGEPGLELALPDIPRTITEPSLRAAYLIEHFWDAMDFGDAARARNADFIEQNFANFISVFPYADAEAQRKGVATLLERASVDEEAYLLVADTAEKYLYDPNSPMLSEDFYMIFLEQLVTSPMFDEYGAVRYKWQLEAVMKNRPGMRAADFAYVTREGRRASLRETRSKGLLLLVFYDPDCSHCKEILTGLWISPMLNAKIDDGEIAVLAVHSGEQKALWEETASEFPSNWQVGYESGLLQENGSYVLRAMPTIYLLDKNKQVVLKDVLPEQLLYYLGSLPE